MSDSQEIPAAASPDNNAIRHFVRGLVGLGISAERLASVEAQLFFDVWDNKVGIRLPILDDRLRSAIEQGIRSRIQKYLED